MKIVIATSNPHKVREIREILSGLPIEIIPASEMGIDLSGLKESGETLEENALLKVRYVWERTRLPSMADDTGLFVEALGGAPGVRSARFAGEGATHRENMEKLLELMEGIRDRRAYFRTVIAFKDEEGEEYTFEGMVDGIITQEPAGEGGFGYDPIFLYPPAGKTFAQMTPSQKNRISHRQRALEEFKRFLWKKLTYSTETEP